MDISLEREGTAIGSLFQQIIADLKNSSPLWEDFAGKANKLYACLRTAIQAIAAYLDAFQKIADAATNSKGASKEIGTALTRVCLRHKAVETRMKTFTSAIMDCLIVPLQDKLEEWKRQAIALDKDHAKEYKRCRAELKKRSQDTLRLQKKARKSSTQLQSSVLGNSLNPEKTSSIKSMVESSMMDVTQRRNELEEVERKSLRAVMIEERVRYCTFVDLLQPVVKEEHEVMYELGHLQEAMQTVINVTREPNVLPQASEELILEIKTPMNYLYPESPSHGSSATTTTNSTNNTNSNSQTCSNSLGSRKSSVCSISSMNSSGSGGASPGHQFQRSLSQLISPVIRLKPGESSDSGFCSSPALTTQASTAANQSHAVSTWPPLCQDGGATTAADRPHTISSAYEKGHQRPALTVYTFQSPADNISESQSQKSSSSNISSRPPIPVRCSSLERPLTAVVPGNKPSNNNVSNLARQCPSPLPPHLTKEHPQLQPTYVNMSELASMAAMKLSANGSQQQLSTAPAPPCQQLNSPVLSTASSLISTDSSATNHQSSPDVSSSATTTSTATPVNSAPETNHNSPLTPVVSHDFDSGFSLDSSAKTMSPENDFKISGSVIEKASLFEKLEQKQYKMSTPPTPSTSSAAVSIAGPMNRSESLYGRRNEEIYKACGTMDRDADKIAEDSIQELNDLIGELDLFQKEHELSTLLAKCQQQQPIAMQFEKSNVTIMEAPLPHPPPLQNTVDELDGVKSSGNCDRRGKWQTSIPLTATTNAILGESAANVRHDLNYNNNNNLRSPQEVEDEIVRNGFENPSFKYLNGGGGGGGGQRANEHEIVLIQDEQMTGETQKYLQENSEIVMLRCKDAGPVEKNYASIGIGGMGNDNLVQSNNNNLETQSQLANSNQRLSSFKNDSPNQRLSANNQQSGISTLKRAHSQNYPASVDKLSHPQYHGQAPDANYANYYDYNGNGSEEVVTLSDEKMRSKPVVSPRPASLLTGCGTRLTRRSSVNTTKPPPPVRRSSSVTPSHQAMGGAMNSPLNLSQQNIMNTSSSESLPPPPAYLLDSANISQSAGNVAEAVKALTDLRHTPASPGVLRRAQMLIQNTNTPQNYAQIPSDTNLYSNQMFNNCYINNSNPSCESMLLHESHSVASDCRELIYSCSSTGNNIVGGNINYNPVILNSTTTIIQSTSLPPQTHHHHQQQLLVSQATKYQQQQQQQLHPNQQHTTTMTATNYASSSSSALPINISIPQENDYSHNYPQKLNETLLNSDKVDGDNTNYRTTTSSPNQGIYAQPKISKMLSFRNQQSPGSSKSQPSTSLIAQLSARLTPGKQQQQQQSHNERYNEAKLYAQQLQQQQNQQQQQPIYETANNKSNLVDHHQQQQQQQHQSYGKKTEYYAPQTQAHDSSSRNNKIYCAPPSSQSKYQVSSPIPIAHQQSSSSSSASHYSINQKIYMSPTNPFLSASSPPSSTSASSPHYHQYHHQNIPKPQQPPPPAPRSYHQNHHHQQQHQQQQQYHQHNHQQNQHHQHYHHHQHHQNQSQSSSSSHPPGKDPGQHQSTFITNPIYNSCSSASGPSSSSTSSYAPQSAHHHSKYSSSPSSANATCNSASSPASCSSFTGPSSSNSNSTAASNRVLSKTSVGFIENLNAKLAEQRLSGKAYAVRTLINSKALPDPRVCHESLMDQIKRGATLRRNRTINDRSAPKIH